MNAEDWAKAREVEVEDILDRLTKVADQIDDLCDQASGLKLNQFRHQVMMIRQNVDACWERLGFAGAYDELRKKET